MQALAHETTIPEEPKPEPQATPQDNMIQLPQPPPIQLHAPSAPVETPRTTSAESTYTKDASTQYENSSPQPPAPTQSLQASTPVKSPQPYAPAPEMVYAQPPVTPAKTLNVIPEFMTCPRCHQHTRVKLKQEPSTQTWIIGAVICAFCPILSWVPCVAKWSYDKFWLCSVCGFELGSQTHTAPVLVTPVVQTPPPTTTAPAQPRSPSGSQYPGKAQY